MRSESSEIASLEYPRAQNTRTQGGVQLCFFAVALSIISQPYF